MPSSASWPPPKLHLSAGASLTSLLDAQEIIASKNVEHSVRWLATIHFKNSIARHWRLRPGQGCCCIHCLHNACSNS